MRTDPGLAGNGHVGGVVSVIVGPEEHGVTRHALALAATTGVRVARHVDPVEAFEAVTSCRRASVCHWHFTDRLFGDDVETAARRFTDVAGRLAVRHVISLHDVPADGCSPRHRRRVDAYRAVTGVADAVVVASDHEQQRLHRAGIAVHPIVIPLPIVGPMPPPNATQPTDPPSTPTVAVLGFIYPGKGHVAVINATAGLPDNVEVLALGRASPGHEDLAGHLAAAAARAGRRFRMTGFVPDDVLPRVLGSVAVPVVAARAVSASASVGTWLAAGRRPIAVRNGYIAELAARGPGLVTMCEPDDLGAAIRRALQDPSSTWRDGPVPWELTEPAVAAAHHALYARVQT